MQTIPIPSAKHLKVTNTWTSFLSKITPIFTFLEADTSRLAIGRIWDSIQVIGFFFSRKEKRGVFERIRIASFFVQLCVDILYLVFFYKRNGDTPATRKIKDYLCIDYIPNAVISPIDVFVSRTLFFRHLSKCMEIEAIYKLNAKEDADIFSYESLLDYNDSATILILGKLKEQKIVLRCNSINIDLIHESDASKLLDSLSISVIKEIVNVLNNSLIEIKAPNANSRWDDYSAKFNVSEFHIPEVFDEHIFNSLYPAVKAAFDKGIKTGILLYGDYGVSKTTTVNYLMSKFDVLKVRVANDAYGLAKTTLEKLDTPKIVVIDDADISSDGAKDSSVAELLNFLDSDSYLVAIIIVNDLENICPAVIRAGRCDIKMYCPKPSQETIFDILKHLSEINNSKFCEIELQMVSGKLIGKTHAIVRAVFNNHLRYNIPLLDATEKTLQMEELDCAE